MLCQKCGKEIKEGGKFCDSCGAEVSADITQGTVPPPIQSGQTSGQNTPAPDDAKKKKQTIIGVATVALGLLAIILGLSALFGGNKAVKLVQNSKLTGWPEKTIEEAFDDFFNSMEWDSYKEDGDTYVICTGKCKADGETMRLKIIFEIDGDDFEPVRVTIDGESYTSASDISEILDIIYY